mgnify:CR=1 FL=1
MPSVTKTTVLRGEFEIDDNAKKILEHFESPNGKRTQALWSLTDFLPPNWEEAAYIENPDYPEGHSMRWTSAEDLEITVVVTITSI